MFRALYATGVVPPPTLSVFRYRPISIAGEIAAQAPSQARRDVEAVVGGRCLGSQGLRGRWVARGLGLLSGRHRLKGLPGERCQLVVRTVETTAAPTAHPEISKVLAVSAVGLVLAVSAAWKTGFSLRFPPVRGALSASGFLFFKVGFSLALFATRRLTDFRFPHRRAPLAIVAAPFSVILRHSCVGLARSALR